ncbi:MAG: arginase [Gammaproteobacteria bacterium]|nr:arginase [Gammaproteobacteria bacterium]
MTRNRPIQIIGVPLDLGASRRGTDAGPSALRIAGLGKGLRKMGYEVSMESDISVPAMETRVAKNDSARFKSEILDVCTRLAQTTYKTLTEGRIPLVIGGDHSIAMGTVAGVSSYYKEQGENIGLIWFDAHGDMNIPTTSPSGNIHGMPLAHLLGHGDDDLSNILGVRPAIKPENVALIGIRDIDDHERRIINDSGVATFTMRDIDEFGMTQVIREVLKVVNTGTVGFHISFDVDGCDPSVMPGSGTLVPGGVSFREAHQLLENCADTHLMTSMEVAELNPFLDQANVSAERTVTLIQSAFGRSIL